MYNDVMNFEFEILKKYDKHVSFCKFMYSEIIFKLQNFWKISVKGCEIGKFTGKYYVIY